MQSSSIKKAEEGVEFAIWQSLSMIIALIGFILVLLAAWRSMKAQEKLANTIQDIVIGLKPKE